MTGTANGLFGVWVAALGTALVQMLWQAALAACALWVAQPWLRRATARARYAAACAALFALPVGFAATVWLAVRSGGVAINWLPALAPGQEAAWMPYLVAAWAAGAAGVGAYSAFGWGVAQRLRRGVSYAVPEAVREQLERLRLALRASKRTRLGVSAAVPGPCVLGWWRPLILLPVSALAGMAPQQLEALLAHELAHIRRHDYLVNLAQRAVEAAFFYHPAVWWISRQVAEEREHCCDDLAIAVCGDRVSYARALVDAAAQAPARVMPAASLAVTGGSLRRRVERILHGALPRRGGSRGAALASGTAMAALALAGLMAASPHTQQRMQTIPSSPAPETPAAMATAARMARFVPTAAAPAARAVEHPSEPAKPVKLALRRKAVAPPRRVTAADAAPPQPQPQAAQISERIVLAWAPTGVQACHSHTVVQPVITPDGRIVFGLRTLTRCQPVLQPVEVLVLST